MEQHLSGCHDGAQRVPTKALDAQDLSLSPGSDALQHFDFAQRRG